MGGNCGADAVATFLQLPLGAALLFSRRSSVTNISPLPISLFFPSSLEHHGVVWCVCVYVFRFYPFHAFFLSFTCCNAHARSWGGLLSSHLCCSFSPPHLLTLSLCRIGDPSVCDHFFATLDFPIPLQRSFVSIFAARGTFTILSPVTVTDCVCVVNFNSTKKNITRLWAQKLINIQPLHLHQLFCVNSFKHVQPQCTLPPSPWTLLLSPSLSLSMEKFFPWESFTQISSNTKITNLTYCLSTR